MKIMNLLHVICASAVVIAVQVDAAAQRAKRTAPKTTRRAAPARRTTPVRRVAPVKPSVVQVAAGVEASEPSIDPIAAIVNDELRKATIETANIESKATQAIAKARKLLEDGVLNPIETAQVIGKQKHIIAVAKDRLAELINRDVAVVKAEQESYASQLMGYGRALGEQISAPFMAGYGYTKEEKDIARAVIAQLEEFKKTETNPEIEEDLDNAIHEQQLITGDVMSDRKKLLLGTIGVAAAVAGVAYLRSGSAEAPAPIPAPAPGSTGLPTSTLINSGQTQNQTNSQNSQNNGQRLELTGLPGSSLGLPTSTPTNSGQQTQNQTNSQNRQDSGQQTEKVQKEWAEQDKERAEQDKKNKEEQDNRQLDRLIERNEYLGDLEIAKQAAKEKELQKLKQQQSERPWSLTDPWTWKSWNPLNWVAHPESAAAQKYSKEHGPWEYEKKGELKSQEQPQEQQQTIAIQQPEQTMQQPAQDVIQQPGQEELGQQPKVQEAIQPTVEQPKKDEKTWAQRNLTWPLKNLYDYMYPEQSTTPTEKPQQEVQAEVKKSIRGGFAGLKSAVVAGGVGAVIVGPNFVQKWRDNQRRLKEEAEQRKEAKKKELETILTSKDRYLNE